MENVLKMFAIAIALLAAVAALMPMSSTDVHAQSYIQIPQAPSQLYSSDAVVICYGRTGPSGTKMWRTTGPLSFHDGWLTFTDAVYHKVHHVKDMCDVEQ